MLKTIKSNTGHLQKKRDKARKMLINLNGHGAEVERSTSNRNIAGLIPTLPTHVEAPLSKTLNPKLLLMVIGYYGKDLKAKH